MNVLGSHWEPPAPSGVAIGVFDGVHLGHQSVIRGLVDECRNRDLACGVLTFDPHPVEVLAPGHAPALLTDIERRSELLEELGVDWVGTLDLSQIRTMSPAEFVYDVLRDRTRCRIVSVGDDFRFGLDRAGDVATLATLGEECEFAVRPVELVTDTEGIISSTRIRTAISDGRLSEAARLLGRPHRLSGEVLHGDARGRTLGFPTANVAPPEAMAVPADGIYAVRVGGAIVADGVASLGVRPTFGEGGARLLEVHLFDVDVDIYGAVLDVDFHARLRGEERFETVDALVEQMNADVALARSVLVG